MTRVFHYLDFTVADEGYPRGSVATMKLPDGSHEVLSAEFDEDMCLKIARWWVDHGPELRDASLAAVDQALANMPTLEPAA